jgi:hypothetical protein
MRAFLKAHIFDVWKVVVNRYTALVSPPTNNARKNFSEYNS